METIVICGEATEKETGHKPLASTNRYKHIYIKIFIPNKFVYLDSFGKPSHSLLQCAQTILPLRVESIFQFLILGGYSRLLWPTEYNRNNATLYDIFYPRGTQLSHKNELCHSTERDMSA